MLLTQQSAASGTTDHRVGRPNPLVCIGTTLIVPATVRPGTILFVPVTVRPSGLIFSAR